MNKLEITTTERGFRKAEFKDRYGLDCSIQESSIATEACLWLGANKGSHYDDNDMPVESQPGKCLARMHLSQEQVKALMPLLKYFLKHGVLPEK